MISNLLMSDAITGVITFFLGMAVVFFGIAILILVIWIIGKFTVRSKKASAKHTNESLSVQINSDSEEHVPAHIVAAITAAIYAYYQVNNEKCEFTVKQIKKRS